MCLPISAHKISYRGYAPSLFVEKKKCATCGNPIDSELFLESAGDFYHEECWARTNRERFNPLVKSKIDQRLAEIQGHLNYLKKFLLFAAILGGLFAVEIAFFQPSNLGLMIATFVTLCVLLAAPLLIVHILREIWKKKKEIKNRESGTML